jgi:hypothetical protein
MNQKKLAMGCSMNLAMGRELKGQPDWSRTAYISELKSSFPMVMQAVMRFSYEFR